MADNEVNILDAIEGKKQIDAITKLRKQSEDYLAKYRASLDDKNRLTSEQKAKAYDEERNKYQVKLEELRRKITLNQEKENARSIYKTRKDLEKQLLEESLSKTEKKLLEITKKVGNNFYSSFTQAVESSTGIYSKYYTQFTTRLQDSLVDASGIIDFAAQKAGVSPYYKLTSLLENVSRLVEAGITDNLTQRAFLSTISDKIASTFDATQESLLEIVRIQKQDTTAARLGLEAELTRLFNYYFGDTSYLSKQFDAVQGILIGTSAQLGAQAGVEFEYQVQKWLGSLGASGVSQNTISQIAQGINYLGTANIQALSGNQQLQNLLIMAANRGGLNYSSLLTGGISASDTNKLLYGLIDFVRSISGNNVVRAQYADLFGISITDMKVIQDLSGDVLENLRKTAMSYNDTLEELNDQLSKVSSRVHLSEKIDNVMSNILTSTGMGVASNAATYGLYKAASLIEGITGGIPIPSPLVLGSGLLLGDMTFEKAIKIGTMGMGLLNPLMAGLNALQGKGSLNYESYAISSTGERQGFRSGASGVLESTTSGATFVSNESMSGTQQSIYDQQTAQGETVSGTKVTEEQKGNEMLLILQFLKDYFSTGGVGSQPLRVSVDNYGLLINGGGAI